MDVDLYPCLSLLLLLRPTFRPGQVDVLGTRICAVVWETRWLRSMTFTSIIDAVVVVHLVSGKTLS